MGSRRYGGRMRWSELFDDLEAQVTRAEREAFEDEVRARAESEAAAITLGAVLAASQGDTVRIALSDGTRLEGEVRDCAAQWLHLGQGSCEWLVPATAIATLDGPRFAAPDPGVVSSRLTLGHALRALARADAVVVVSAGDTRARGTVRVVGADYLVVESGAGRTVIPFAAILSVSSAP